MKDREGNLGKGIKRIAETKVVRSARSLIDTIHFIYNPSGYVEKLAEKIIEETHKNTSPQLADLIEKLIRGEITEAEYQTQSDALLLEMYGEPTAEKVLLQNLTVSKFHQFMGGQIDQQQLNQYIEKLNADPDGLISSIFPEPPVSP